MTKTISREQIKQWMDNRESMTIVEALPARYYRKGHLPGAVNIPHEEIRARAPQDLPDKDSRIVVYCASTECQNSAIAADSLQRLGYRNVFEYVAGKQDWSGANYPLEASKRGPGHD